MGHTTENFFQRVLADKGFPVVVSLKKGTPVYTQVCESMPDFLKTINQESNKAKNTGRELYFGISTLERRFVIDAKSGKTHTRVATNCLETRALILDIDIDSTGFLKGDQEKHCYKTQEEAIEGVNLLCSLLNLNAPYVVSSGYGLHCYWPFEHGVESDAWAVTAGLFRGVCNFIDTRLVVDPSRVADRAGILRIPNTYNYKNATVPQEVKIISACAEPIWPYKFYKEHLDYFVQANEITDFIFVADKKVKKGQIVNLETEFTGEKVDFKKLYGTKEEDYTDGCLWINSYMRNKAKGKEEGGPDYESWRAMVNLSVHSYLTIPAGKPYLGKILNHGKETRIEGVDLAKYVSMGHPEYDEAATIAKYYDAASSPRLSWRQCDSLKALNSAACEKCVFKDLVRSPLGIARVSKPAEKIEVENPVIVQGTNIGVEAIELPKPPYPFTIGTDGGVYKAIKDSNGQRSTAQVVYEYTLLPVRRIRDEATGLESIELEVRLPHEQAKRFTLPSGLLQDQKLLAKELANRGIYVIPKMMIELVDYIIKYVQLIQRVEAVNNNYSAFGWKDTTIGTPKFALYDCIITQHGVKAYKNTTKGLEEYGKCASSKGDLEKWKQAFNIYRGVEGMEPHIINLMLAFGAPLLHFLDQFGFVFNLFGQSGRGKSSSLSLATSVWGYPQASYLTAQDTTNALYSKLGIINNLPATYDEITTIAPEALSELTYLVTMGRGRDALDRDRNLKQNQPRWHTFLLTTSNHSLYTKLATLGAGNNAQGYRILEYHAPAPNNTINERMHVANEIIKEHHGVAGRKYMEYILAHYGEVMSKVRQAVTNLSDKDRSRERFWVAAQAIIQVGGYISKELGLHDYEPGELLEYMRGHNPREEVEAIIGDPVSKLNEYFLQNLSNTIREIDDRLVNTELEFKGIPNIAVRLQGHGQQIEKAYIPTDNLRRWCKLTATDYTWLKSELEDTRVLMGQVKKRIGAGTKYFSLAANCWCLDMQHPLVTGHERKYGTEANVVKLSEAMK